MRNRVSSDTMRPRPDADIFSLVSSDAFLPMAEIDIRCRVSLDGSHPNLASDIFFFVASVCLVPRRPPPPAVILYPFGTKVSNFWMYDFSFSLSSSRQEAESTCSIVNKLIPYLRIAAYRAYGELMLVQYWCCFHLFSIPIIVCPTYPFPLSVLRI